MGTRIENMILLDIDPRFAKEYAMSSELVLVEIHAAEEDTYDLISVIKKCLRVAEEKKCTQFVFKKILNRFNFLTEGRIWQVEIFAFREKNS